MPAAAFLVTIRPPVARRPFAAAPVPRRRQSARPRRHRRRAEQFEFYLCAGAARSHWNNSAAAAVRTGCQLGAWHEPTAATSGLMAGSPAVRSRTAAAPAEAPVLPVVATIHRTGTTRDRGRSEQSGPRFLRHLRRLVLGRMESAWNDTSCGYSGWNKPRARRSARAGFRARLVQHPARGQ